MKTRNTKPKKSKLPARVPYFSTSFYEAWKPSIEAALEGKEIEIKVKDSHLTELSLFTQVRSVLRFAEQAGMRGAKALKAYRLGDPDDRYILVKKFESVRPTIREAAV